MCVSEREENSHFPVLHGHGDTSRMSAISHKMDLKFAASNFLDGNLLEVKMMATKHVILRIRNGSQNLKPEMTISDNSRCLRSLW